MLPGATVPRSLADLLAVFRLCFTAPTFSTFVGLLVGLIAQTRHEAYLKLTELAAIGALHVDTLPLPLSDCDKAWELQQQGAPAKLVLTPQSG